MDSCVSSTPINPAPPSVIRLPRPRERLWAREEDELTSEELLELVLSPGTSHVSAQDAAARLLGEFGGATGLVHRSARELAAIRGVGQAKACRLWAAFELGRRAQQRAAAREPLDRPARSAAYLRRHAHEASEVAVTVALDSQLKALRNWVVGRGSSNRCVLSPREVFLPALREGAAFVLFGHSHPGGETHPSAQDLRFTERLVEAGRLLGVPVVDHIVFSREGWTSLATLGHVPQPAPMAWAAETPDRPLRDDGSL